MSKKRGLKHVLFVSLLTLFSAILLIQSPAAAQPTPVAACIAPGLQDNCGIDVATNQTGHGAVELCSKCFTCGVLDGVCPETFSDGTNETEPDKRSMVLRLGRDRPNQTNSVIFPSAAAACSIIGGTCSYIQLKTTIGGAWGGGLPCTTNVATYPHYMRAICNAPRTAGCQDCPDPDCLTNVSGNAFNVDTNESLNVVVNIVSETNQDIWSLKDSSGGSFALQGPRGNVKVICTAYDYEPYVYQAYLQPEQNRIDCRMQQATCANDCTLPSDTGENVCRSRCQLNNGCLFGNDTTYGYIADYCEGVAAGATKVIERIDATHCATVTCCEGSVQVTECPLFSLAAGSDIKNIYTKDIRKQYQGSPVTLKVITYQKE